MALIAAVAAPQATAAAAGYTCGDGKTSHTYAEPRTYVDAQGWWTATDPASADASNDSGHVHVGACIPAWQDVPAGDWDLRVRIVMHEHTGRFERLNVTTKGPGYENKPYKGIVASELYLDPDFTQPAGDGTWEGDPAGTTVRWAKVTLNSTRDFNYAGLQEVRLRAFTVHDGERFTGVLNFRVNVPESTGKTVKDFFREPYLRAKGIYTDRAATDPADDKSYCEATLHPDALPTGPVSGTWRVPVVMADHKTANNDNAVSHHRAAIDFNAHMNLPGVELVAGDGDWPASNPTVATDTTPDFGTLSIDTTQLADGWHALSIKADCVDTMLNSGGASTQSGHLVVRFEVANDQPAPALEVDAAGDANGDSWQVYRFEVAAPGTITATLSWDVPEADLNVFLRPPGSNKAVAWGNDTGPGPEVATVDTTQVGEWTAAVKTKTGATAYHLEVLAP